MTTETGVGPAQEAVRGHHWWCESVRQDPGTIILALDCICQHYANVDITDWLRYISARSAQVIENLLQSVDAMIIGGGMAYTFKKVVDNVSAFPGPKYSLRCVSSDGGWLRTLRTPGHK